MATGKKRRAQPREATKAQLIRLMESMYEHGWGGGPPSNEDLAEAMLKKYRVLPRVPQ